VLDFDRCEIELITRGLFSRLSVVTVDLIMSQGQLRLIQDHALLMYVVFYTAESVRIHAFELLERRDGRWREEYADEQLARITLQNAREGVEQFKEMLSGLAEGADEEGPPFDPDEMARRVARGPRKEGGGEAEDEC
jgi:hypothetical protein